MFRDRSEAARALASQLRDRSLRDPLILGIPRGGVIMGAVLARELGADLDVVLARKLRAPGQPELAIGAVSESGEIYLDPCTESWVSQQSAYLALERKHQMEEIARRQKLLRQVR